ncbi:MAG: ion transporter, partial [Albidovulum sp.]
AVVNLVVGLIVNSMQDAHHTEENERTATHRDEILDRLTSIERLLTDKSGNKPS